MWQMDSIKFVTGVDFYDPDSKQKSTQWHIAPMKFKVISSTGK